MIEREWIPVSTAAGRLGLAVRTVQEMCARGALRSRKKNPHARRPTYEVYVPALEAMERARGSVSA